MTDIKGLNSIFNEEDESVGFTGASKKPSLGAALIGSLVQFFLLIIFIAIVAFLVGFGVDLVAYTFNLGWNLIDW